ncbi:PRC-barrel domain-containing protein [Modestobacter roseus]|uniref:PRC-barrel domain protein n=1 Tax=Modestobacter roseus TaxID=1181884 RepID=A0A562IVP3_9ACTN|nr:PRC-barrel domain-containing protein [Modestobacter roseus]MQA35981.1 PRC-barrel domain containing protein [Modestobacter roseus]TWH75028.1 PRC-barrel domain protein [Modestobacter roseus]
MFPAENIRDWRTLNVVDPDGHKIGTLESVYVDTTTDQPFFAAVMTGMIGRRQLTFVPLTGATVSPEHIRVTVPKDLAKDAPSIDTDGELAAEQEPAVFEHYSLPYTSGVRRLARR